MVVETHQTCVADALSSFELATATIAAIQ